MKKRNYAMAFIATLIVSPEPVTTVLGLLVLGGWWLLRRKENAPYRLTTA